MPISKTMFHKAINGTSGSLPKKTQQQIEEATRNSSALNNVIQSCINQSNGQSFTTTDCSGGIAFTSGDLYYAIDKADYEISGERIDDIYWNIDVNLHDTYDFTRLWLEPTIGALANNLGYYMQQYGLLEPYYWEVNYTRIYVDD